MRHFEISPWNREFYGIIQPRNHDEFGRFNLASASWIALTKWTCIPRFAVGICKVQFRKWNAAMPFANAELQLLALCFRLLGHSTFCLVGLEQSFDCHRARSWEKPKIPWGPFGCSADCQATASSISLSKHCCRFPINCPTRMWWYCCE